MSKSTSRVVVVCLLAGGCFFASCGGTSVVGEGGGGSGGEGPCTQDPRCDRGDEQVARCDGSSSLPCYDVTECGHSVHCLDSADSEGCPWTEPAEGSQCEESQVGVQCSYEAEPDCTNTYLCDQLYPDPNPNPANPKLWFLVDSDCPGP